jgi:hypothetical protein
MTGGSFFDRWLMGLATANPPAGREDWARAMRAEFETLEHGRTSWALGCLGASLGWRTRLDGIFLLAIALLPFTLWMLQALLSFWLPRQFSYDYAVASVYVSLWGSIALSCLLLAAVRPRYWIAVGISAPLFFEAICLVEFALLTHRPIRTLLSVHVMDARLDVGVGAEIGYGLLGALIGRGLGNLLRRGSPKRRRQV